MPRSRWQIPIVLAVGSRWVRSPSKALTALGVPQPVITRWMGQRRQVTAAALTRKFREHVN